MNSYASQALEEYNTLTVRPGGVNGNPFWNVNAMQFTYAPSFYFPTLPNGGARGVLFTATDKNGDTHTFRGDSATAALTPIWSELPTGVVTLKAEALDKNGCVSYLLGVRTFFKCSPFPGRENLPAKDRPYRDAAMLAFRYVFTDSVCQHWLKEGKPDPEFPLNVYPAKTFGSVINAMLAYAKLSPESADEAMQIAKAAADYMIAISYGEDSPLCGLPPTYYYADLNVEKVRGVAPAAEERKDTVMLIYPAEAGNAYLALFEATGEQKYFDAATRIAAYYREHVQPNGNWYLQISAITGQPAGENFCNYIIILKFLTNMYNHTGDDVWRTLGRNYFAYLKERTIERFNWEAQFEDSPVCANYDNLSHVNANEMIEYLLLHERDMPGALETATELMRFVEDQFVVWGEYPPWMEDWNPDAPLPLPSPASLEQYACYWPIDACTCMSMVSFLYMYQATGNRLYYEKAAALGDKITRMQYADSGAIPTFWLPIKRTGELLQFWLNCHIASAFALGKLAEAAEEIEA